MQRKTVPIESLLLRTFLPAVVMVAMVLAILVYNWLYSSILDGFERKLVTTSALTGAMVDPSDHDWLIEAGMQAKDPETIEAMPIYERNAGPIRRIREQLGLTYLYSQVIGGPSDILYILDGSEGDEHSPIGYEDDLPDETMAGLGKVEKAGLVYVSPIEYQEQWGLLKTAAAPILGSDGKITASAGADVNMSVIQVATQNALFASAMIGVGSILACIVVAFVLVRRIAKPMEALTEDTLRIAAGGSHILPAVPATREVFQLREALGSLAMKMQLDTRQRDDAFERHEAEAAAAVLGEAISADSGDAVILMDSPEICIAWVAGDGLDARAVLARLAMQRLAGRIAAEPQLAQVWKDLVDLVHGGCVIVDRGSRSIDCVGQASPTVIVSGREVELEAGSPVAFGITDSVSLSGPGGLRTVVEGAIT